MNPDSQGFGAEHWQSLVLLLADARLPAGGHAFSSGMEPALQGGMAVEQVREYLAVRARTTALIDAATAVVARNLAIARSSSENGAEFVELVSEHAFVAVERAWAARTPSSAVREASVHLGRGLLRLIQQLWPQSKELANLPSSCPRPVVLGTVAALGAIPADTLVRISVYDDLAGAVAALLKLEPCDPASATRLLLDACAAAEPFTEQLASLTLPEQIPAYSAPQQEAWAQMHAISNRRLFRG